MSLPMRALEDVQHTAFLSSGGFLSKHGRKMFDHKQRHTHLEDKDTLTLRRRSKV